MATNKANGYLPDDYEQPSGMGGFTELKDGDNHLRILSKPLLVWVIWEDGKVKRIPYTGKDSKPPTPTTTKKDSVKHAWVVVAWNYDTSQIEIWEISQATIISDIISTISNPKWGMPHEYDFVVNKSGQDLKTKYKATPEPKSEITDEVMAAFESTPIDLEEMLKEDGKPFLTTGKAAGSSAPAPKKEKAEDKVITADNWVVGDKVPAGYKEEGGKLIKKKTPF